LLRERREMDYYMLKCGEGRGAELSELHATASDHRGDLVGQVDTALDAQAAEDKVGAAGSAVHLIVCCCV
jgi:hypothetical protein